MNIAVAGIGYVGLAMAVLLSQRHHVTAVDVAAQRVEMLNRRQSPIQDADIGAYLSERKLDLTATLDAGFGTDTNIVTLISHGGTETLPLMSKREVAHRIWDAALALRGAEHAGQ